MKKISIKYHVLSILGIFVLYTLYILHTTYYISPVFAQACPIPSASPRVIDGLISAAAIISDKFSNAAGICAVDSSKISFAPFKIPTYDDLKSIYFDQSKLPPAQKITLTGNQTQSSIDLSNTPHAPYVTSSKSCLTTSTYLDSELTISWDNTLVTQVKISDGTNTWTRNVSGSSTTGPFGFTGATGAFHATVGTTYSFSVSNGTFGPAATFGIRACLPPICTAISDPSSVEINNTANFTATASDPEGTLLTYAWTASTGTPASGTSTGFAWTAPNSAGSAVINLRVTSANGGAADCPAKTVTVALPPPPVCTSIDGVSTVEVNSPASPNFTATASDPRGAPLTYAWTASAGTPASGSSSSFAWTAPIKSQINPINLRVTGPGGFTDCPIKNVTTTVPTNYKRVFVAGPTNGGLSGVTGANSTCQTAANNASLGGTWKAWLSDGTTTAASNLAQSGIAYKSVDGATQIASSWTNLIGGTLQNPINKKASGTSVGTVNVWTNTTISGTSIITGNVNENCLAFTSGSGGTKTAKIGSSAATNNTWTNLGTTNTCNTPNYIYCFEQ